MTSGADVLSYLFDPHSPGKPCDFGTPDCTVDHRASEDAVTAGVLCDAEVAVIETRQEPLKVTAGRWFDTCESVPLVALGTGQMTELSPPAARRLAAALLYAADVAEASS